MMRGQTRMQVSAHCRVLLCTAVYCRVLRCTAVYSRVLPYGMCGDVEFMEINTVWTHDCWTVIAEQVDASSLP